MELGNLLKKEFRVVTVKMVKELGRRPDTQSEKLDIFNKGVRKQNNHIEMKNTTSEMKNIQNSGPRPYWHQGLVLWKTSLP